MALLGAYGMFNWIRPDCLAIGESADCAENLL
jgi:hypothetical protein